MDNQRNRYMARRKFYAFILSVLFHLYRIFPVCDNLIAVCTFEGKGGFGCNPKYIVEELHRRNNQYRFVWFVNDMSKVFPDYIMAVKNTPLKRAYYMSRAKVWIDNYRTPYGVAKRNGQYYLNTNHYTLGIKCVGLWRGRGFSRMAYLVSRSDSEQIDDLIIDSLFGEEMCPKGLLFNGRLLKTGAPRCDILYGNRDKCRQRFRQSHGLPEDAKVVMYAPTFREGEKNGRRSVYSHNSSLDFENVLLTLKERFGGDWYVCVRMHPQLLEEMRNNVNMKNTDRIIDESFADDMYEILAGMDAYITDYSSACFEAGVAGIPVFLYMDDLDEYKESRGALFWEISSNRTDHFRLNRQIFKSTRAYLPFPIAKDNAELTAQIAEFDELSYRRGLYTFCKDIDLLFDGQASRRVADEIERHI